MKRPLTAVALLYIAGILFGEFLRVDLGVALLTGSLLTTLALLSKQGRTYLVPAFIFAAGVANALLHASQISPVDIRATFGEASALVQMRGEICSAVSERTYLSGETESIRSQVQIRAYHWSPTEKTEWQPVEGTVVCLVNGSLPNTIARGDLVQITGLISRPGTPRAPGLFNYRRYLDFKGIHYQLEIDRPTDFVRLTGSASPPLEKRLVDLGRRLLLLGLPQEDETVHLMWTMTLGWKGGLDAETSEAFLRSGTMHIFAISGLHIALLAGIVLGTLRVFRVPRAVGGLIVIPLLWAYTALTGWQASAVRSTIMMTIIIAGWGLRRPVDLINSLSAGALLILLWRPRELFQAGFQLSFFVVLAIALLLPLFHRWCDRLLQPDPLLPPELRPRWQRWLDLPARFVVGSFATSLAAWIGSLPLTAYYFNLVTPGSLLANVIVVPLSSLALASNLGALALGTWLPPVAELFNHSGWFFMKAMVRTSEWFAALPFAAFYVKSPTLLECALFYLGSGVLLSLAITTTARRLRFIAFIVIAAGGITLHTARELRSTDLVVLPLGSGHAVWYDAPGSRNDLLVDCGNLSDYEFVLKPFLRAQGVDQLPRLLLTHGDANHVGAAFALISDFQPTEILAGAAPSRSPTMRKLANDPALALRMVASGSAIDDWRVLHPDHKDHFTQADDNAVVLSKTIGGKTILLLSDLGRQGAGRLIEHHPTLKADIVVIGVQGGGSVTSETVVAHLNPAHLIVADSNRPQTARASRATRRALGRFSPRYCSETRWVSLHLKGGTTLRDGKE